MKNNIIKTLILSLFLLPFFTLTTDAMSVDYLAGKDRYETAALISNKISYSSAILVNGTALVDGLSASGLSGALNAPILLTEKDTIPLVTLEKIENASLIYLIGGQNVISPNIETKLRNMGKKTARIGGTDRYSTSYLVADEINRIKGISEIYYVNGLTGEADAMSIAPVASKNGNPVILTNGLNTNYRKSVKAYSIGGFSVLSQYFDSFSERLGGKTRFETNKIIVNKFFPNKSHVYLSKSEELIDALTSSALKEPVILINNESDKSVIASAKSMTVLGNIDQIAVNRAKSYIYSNKVVFYSQHQDDETLFAGSTIIDAIEAVGKDNVFIVLISDGDESGVFLGDRYNNLSVTDRAKLRNNEFVAATTALGIPKENLVFLNQPEKIVDKDLVANTMLKFENDYGSITHITHSYIYESHPQHLETGELLYNLYNKGLIKDCRFFSRKDLIPKNNAQLLIQSVADNESEREKVINACYEYKLDRKDMIREGIGYKSVQSLFDNLISDPLTISYLHEPGL